MSLLLDGDVAVVTCSANGIGRATARTFAGHGGDVVIADLDETTEKAARQRTN